MNGYCFRLVRFLLLLVLSVNVAWAEGRSEDTVIYDNCAQMPVLNYRYEPSRQWLEVFSHTRFSALPALRMKVHVEFVVEKDGRLTHAHVIDSPDKALADSLVSAARRITARSVAFDKVGNAIRYRWRLPMDMRLSSSVDCNVYGVVQHIDATTLTLKTQAGVMRT